MVKFSGQFRHRQFIHVSIQKATDMAGEFPSPGGSDRIWLEELSQ